MNENQAESSTDARRRNQRKPKPNRDPMFLYATEFTEGRRNGAMFSDNLAGASVNPSTSRPLKRKTPMTIEEKRKKERERKRAARARISPNC
ncbi:hypothetical protein A0J61_11311, partial [Choanephora cucurbitarum]